MSIIYFVKKISTLLNAILNVVFGSVYFVVVISTICGLKMPFSKGSQNSISEKSIFGQFEVIFLSVQIFSRTGWFFPVSTFKEE